MEKMKCYKCEHKWTPRTKIPLSCPNCKSRHWNIKGFSQCEVCGRNFMYLALHHKDGNDLNNNRFNLIKLCVDCHAVIHNGLSFNTSKRIRKYKGKNEVKYNLIKLREFWLNQKKKCQK